MCSKIKYYNFTPVRQLLLALLLTSLLFLLLQYQQNTSSVVDSGFEHRSSQSKDFKMCICCIVSKHAVLMRCSKTWLPRNEDNVFEWNHISTSGLLLYYNNSTQIVLLLVTTMHVYRALRDREYYSINSV